MDLNKLRATAKHLGHWEKAVWSGMGGSNPGWEGRARQVGPDLTVLA